MNGTRLTYKAEDLIQAAKRSVATISPAKELILRGKVRTLQHLQEWHAELTKILTGIASHLCWRTLRL